jgi:uridine kinase
MSTALLISGYLRTFKYNIPNIKKLTELFDNIDIYIHITKDENKEDKYLNRIDYNELISFINSELKPKTLLIEKNSFFDTDKKKNDLFNSWSKFSKLNDLKKLNEINQKKSYDMVIKYRPDLYLKNFDFFDFKLNEKKIYIPKESLVDKNKLSSRNDKFICDLMAFGNSSLMDKYFSVFKFLDDYSKKYKNISETILYHYLTDKSIPYELIDVELSVLLSECNVFAICGDSGSGKTTLGNKLKYFFKDSFILECDRYHKWERSDPNWDNYTHLNPNANFLSKMEEDIFNLKIGNKIYQVDYDHSTGKFTDQIEINPSKNTIVCGLHSLYTENKNIYNLKIFIDTDDILKKKWKIDRDVNERGYTINNVLKKIESRKDDFEKYILPQKNESDIIITFFLSDKNEISLKMSINKKFDCSEVIYFFVKNNISLDTIDDGDFKSLIFEKYLYCKMWENNEDYPIFGNYYDYIIFTIIKIVGG